MPHFDAKAEADAYFAGADHVPASPRSTGTTSTCSASRRRRATTASYGWAFPMGNAKMAGIAAEDIGKVAYGIFKAGQQYIGKTVGIAGEASPSTRWARSSKGLGIGPVQYNAVDADVYRSFGFPGADEMGNMFQDYRDFEKEDAWRIEHREGKLNPQLQSFDQFLAKNKDKVRPRPSRR